MSGKQICAVSFGVSQYRNLSLLPCAKNDAQDAAELVGSAVNVAEVKLLLDADATKQAILRELNWLANSVGSDDTAIVFFSGHGGRRSMQAEEQCFLCPVEASLLNVEQTCITGSELTALLRTIKSARLLVLLDTCYSGGIGEPRHNNAGAMAGLTSRDVDTLIEGNGRIIMSASRPDESAWELSGMRNGLFTNYLLRGLRGEIARPDGTIWSCDIFSYISRNIREHGCQHPYQKAIGEDFVVMTQHRNTSSHSTPPFFKPPKIDQRSLRLMMRNAYNRNELSLLCRDLGVSLEDLSGTTLETQMMDLIDHCHRHGLYNRLLERIRIDRPQLSLSY
jgi:hypothetical protein